MITKARKITALILTLCLMMALLTGCGKKASEKIAENIIKDVTGADVSISGEQVEIKGEDGEKVTVGGNIAWPKDKLGDLPQLPGKIESFFESEETGCTLYCVGTKKQEAEAFIKALKDLGYTENAYEGEDEDGMLTYFGSNGSHLVNFAFFPEGGSGPDESSCTLSYGQQNN